VLFLLQKSIWQIKGGRQALFVGFFGPIGVSAIFYQHIALEFLREEILGPNDDMRGDVRALSEALTTVVWFMVLCSIVSTPSFLRAFLATAEYIKYSASRVDPIAGRSRSNNPALSAWTVPCQARKEV
jgi:NhaP-type Na+/H+ or K+/H+ antiporter